MTLSITHGHTVVRGNTRLTEAQRTILQSFREDTYTHHHADNILQRYNTRDCAFGIPKDSCVTWDDDKAADNIKKSVPNTTDETNSSNTTHTTIGSSHTELNVDMNPKQTIPKDISVPSAFTTTANPSSKWS